MSDRALGLPFLVRLRWGALFGQIAALAVARFALGAHLPWGLLCCVLALGALTNALVTRVPRFARHEHAVPALLVVDVVSLTIVLGVSGGAANPFTVFFLVEVALASLLLPPRTSWALALLSIAGFGSLFLVGGPGEVGASHAHCAPWSQHLVGMWIAYALSASFVAHFVGRVSHAIRERDRQRAEIDHMAAQNERLATLSSFSANAAHELGTPLATIGLAAKELARAATQRELGSAVVSDAELIGREVARCRAILAELTSRAGESIGEMPVRTSPARVVSELRARLSRAISTELVVEFSGPQAEHSVVVAPACTLAQMLANLVRNAHDAHQEAGVDAPVRLRVDVDDRVGFHVLDEGGGLPASVEARLGEPFVTTKPGLGGLGLGIYLARTFADRVGGQLRFVRRPGGGTDAGLFLQCSAIPR
jgi:two-component system sensor histidine kinase RegB